MLGVFFSVLERGLGTWRFFGRAGNLSVDVGLWTEIKGVTGTRYFGSSALGRICFPIPSCPSFPNGSRAAGMVHLRIVKSDIRS